ncbi:helix-turn-helix domain-containing protein [Brevibacterium jeotgali]|uniref:helix-turn-helix domain-containing protein n=1 Tax=Brevibacterium jeotgali TaxID=1262550 RepID=UPI00119A00A4|nr:helix-turn-helix domain-containing protein [Brevibacterium jeotgali]TWC01549.1 excisionase family DNA binding protein [Brevibacterium jeotgali]
MMGAIAHEQARQLRSAVDKMFHELSDSSGVPESARNAFLRLVDVLESNSEVIVLPSETFMTTQQAADLLGVSRMTVVRLIDRGELVTEGGGVHRRIAAAELARYRAASAARRRAALQELSQEIDDSTPPDQVIRTR